MILKIGNQARDYAWGSTHLISDYFGTVPTGSPMAEIWYGTHAGSPTQVLGQSQTLLEARGGEPLPFLLKVLAAGQPLSIQAHPNLEQAKAGFDRENSSGLEISDPNRDYKDANHKPEMIVALTDFDALIGFRPVSDIAVSLRRMAMLAQQLQLTDLETALGEYHQLLRLGGVKALFRGVLGRRGKLDAVCEQLAVLAVAAKAEQNVETQNLQLVPQLQQLYPGDPGVFISQLMNVVHLKPLEAAELPAGNIHAYLSGLGVEVMAASDNVLRGGLTPKRINVEELLQIVQFESSEVRPVSEASIATGVTRYVSSFTDYTLDRIDVDSQAEVTVQLSNPAILLCTDGRLTIEDLTGSLHLQAGEAAYLAGAEKVSVKADSSVSARAFLASF